MVGRAVCADWPQSGVTNWTGSADFVVIVVFAANCAFATPFAYQTSLLVMGPGSYQFKDFLKVGSPVVIIIWIVFSLIAPWYYGI
jgi:di/tricarboxylate transporter